MEKIFINLKRVTLTREEKSGLRRQLIADLGLRQTTAWWSLYRWRLVVAPLAVVLVVGGGLTAVAERALPGDLLYPLKLKINEPVVRALIDNSAQTQIEFDTRLVEKRLVEAEKLDAKQKLDLPKTQKIREEVVRQAGRVKTAEQKETARLESAPAADVMMMAELGATTSEVGARPVPVERKERKLEMVLEKHEEIIEKLEIEVINIEEERQLPQEVRINNKGNGIKPKL